MTARNAVLLRKTAPPFSLSIPTSNLFGRLNQVENAYGYLLFGGLLVEDILNAVGCPGDVQKGGPAHKREKETPANKNVLHHSGNGWIFPCQVVLSLCLTLLSAQ